MQVTILKLRLKVLRLKASKSMMHCYLLSALKQRLPAVGELLVQHQASQVQFLPVLTYNSRRWKKNVAWGGRGDHRTLEGRKKPNKNHKTPQIPPQPKQNQPTKTLQISVYKTEASKHYLTDLVDVEDRTEKAPELTPLHPRQNQWLRWDTRTDRVCDDQAIINYTTSHPRTVSGAQVGNKLLHVNEQNC